MNILTAIFNSVFSVISSCFSVLDIDMFVVGFTILDFFIAILLLGLVFRFLGKSVNVADRFNLISLIGSTSLISNNEREKQIVTTSMSNIYHANNNSTSYSYRKTIRNSSGFTDTHGTDFTVFHDND